MNIYDFAYDFELEHQDFYLKQAKESNNLSFKKIFLDLAKEEEKHAKIIRKLSGKNKFDLELDDIFLIKVKDILTKISKNLPENILPEEQVDIYKRAAEMEKRSYNFYKEKAEAVEDEGKKKVLLALAIEEKKHENIINNIVKLVNRPNTWIEDAEWYHLEEY